MLCPFLLHDNSLAINVRQRGTFRQNRSSRKVSLSIVTHFRRGGNVPRWVWGTMTITVTSCHSRKTITPRLNGPQVAVNYRVRSALVSAAFEESLVAARNFRCNKETHIWRFHYQTQLFQGRDALNKFIRHLTIIKDTRHAEARVIATVLSPLNTRNRQIIFIISRRRSAEKR